MHKSNQTLSILFWLNRQRSKNQQPAIYLRFTLDYKRVELATHLYVDEQQWNPQGQCVKSSAIEAPEINRQLAIMKANLLKHYGRFQALDKPISAEILKNAYLGIGERQTTLQEALEFYNNRFAEKVRTGHKAANTLKCLRTTRDKVLAFVNHRFLLADIPLTEIKPSFAPDFEHFLTTRRSWQQYGHEIYQDSETGTENGGRSGLDISQSVDLLPMFLPGTSAGAADDGGGDDLV